MSNNTPVTRPGQAPPHYSGSLPSANVLLGMGMVSAVRYREVQALLNEPLLQRASAPDHNLIITKCHGLAASVFAAWEAVTRRAPDGAVYRRMNDGVWRKVGSALLPLEQLLSPETAQAAYRAEYRRAYSMIYRAHPSLQGIGHERDGEVVVRAPLNDLFL